MNFDRNVKILAILTNTGVEQCSHKVWKLKVRVIRFWTVSQFVKYGMKAPIEMVVLDEE
ncbi:hypothetical protein HN873_039620, partial [Arachis hypogaea]